MHIVHSKKIGYSSITCIVFHRYFQYVKREIAKFFGVDVASEERERVKWSERQKRLALRRFGSLKQVNVAKYFWFILKSFEFVPK